MPDLPAPSPALVFARDLPCIHCSYNLRTIPLGAPCPECGRPSSDSLDSLPAALPADLSRVRLGLLLAALAASAVPALSSAIWMVVVSLPYSSTARLGIVELAGTAAVSGFGFVGPVLAFIGVWFFTIPIRRGTRDTGIPLPPVAHSPSPLRAAALAYPILSGIVMLLYAIAVFFLRSGPWDGIAFAAIVITTTLFAGLSWTSRNALACAFIATLSRRTGSRKIARLFDIMAWISRAAACLVLLLGLLILIGFTFSKPLERTLDNLSDNTGEALGLIAAALSSIVSIGFFAWLAAWPIMLFIAYAHLGRAATQATANLGALLVPEHTLENSLAPPTAPVHRQNPQSPSPGETAPER